MNSSQWYAEKIKELEGVKSDMSTLITSLDDCSASVSSAKTYTDTIIISGKTFDDGKLDEFSGSLATVRGNLQSIINECNEKITLFEVERLKAIERENAARNQLKNTDSLAKPTIKNFTSRMMR